MKLNQRFFWLMMAIFLAFMLAAWLLFVQWEDRVNREWGRHFASHQSAFNKLRTFSPLLREIELARQMAADPAIIDMALREQDETALRRGVGVLEEYRLKFRDRSYFAAFAASGHYYFNDAENRYAGRQMRYTLSPDSAADKWFYATLADGREYQINLDPDVHLNVVKVWVNVKLMQGNKTLGVIGTGLDLTEFLKQTVGTSVEGVHNIYVDASRAIQLHTDPSQIDYMTIAKEVTQRKKVDHLLQGGDDVERLRLGMREVDANPSVKSSLWVTYQGVRHLLVVTKLPEIGWYDLTLVDTENLRPIRQAGSMLAVFMLAFLLALIAMGVALRRWILRPVARLRASVERMQRGEVVGNMGEMGSVEFSDLSSAFVTMAIEVGEARHEVETKLSELEQIDAELKRVNASLEDKVAQRTTQLRQSESRFRQMFERHSSPMLLVEPESGEVIAANRAAAGFYGYSVEQMCRMNIAQINVLNAHEIAAERQRALNSQCNYFVFPHRLASGEVRTVEVHSSPVEVEGRPLLFSIIHDITERMRLEGQMHELAFYDGLTGLPNRRLLVDRLGKVLVACARSHRHGALMFLDLDHFKKINDLYGHDQGDQLIVEVARRIQSCIRELDSAARFGGDEFVVMLDGLSVNRDEAAVQAEVVAEKIRSALEQPYSLKRATEGSSEDVVSYYCSSSIGVTVFGDRDENTDLLLKRTDMAMYLSKEAGRNTIRFYDPEMQAAIEVRAALESDLREAIERRQFELFYQAQVNYAGKLLGAEALLRWHHPVRGLVHPGEFISLAEETGLILPIGGWVLETVCAQLARWRGDPLFGNITLAVNVSAKQFRQPDFAGQVQAVVMKHGINPASLKLELTESLVLEEVDDAIAKMKFLKEYGIGLSIDDFGTGYSSLSYLKRLPLSQIKLDQSFIRSITTDQGDRVMVMTVVDLGMNFELDVVAEGVETEAQLRLLHRYGCDIFQGYLFGVPLAAVDFEESERLRRVSQANLKGRSH
ncbi:MAG: EAL domain-containing protein [Nitrosomonadales bacterium]|nr:EAL domain-containing protein [Nitrosomonadales bacterium]